MRHILLWMDALYVTTFGLLKKKKKKKNAYCHSKAWKSKDNFLYNSDRILLKEERHTPRMP